MVDDADACDASPLCKWNNDFGSSSGGECTFDTGNNPHGFAYKKDENVTAHVGKTNSGLQTKSSTTEDRP